MNKYGYKDGQTVWCLLQGKGKVLYTLSESVAVMFESSSAFTYLGEGLPRPNTNRTLFFSEPVITAETEPPFEAKLKAGDLIVAVHRKTYKADYSMVVTEDSLYVRTDSPTGMKPSFRKEDYHIYLVGDKIY